MTVAPTASDRTVFVGVHVDPEIKDRFAELARSNDRSLSAELRIAMRRHLDEPAAPAPDK